TTTLTIVDNDFPPGRLNFSVSSFTNSESDGAAVIRVTRSGGNVGVVTVQFSTSDGTATSPSDYASTNGTLTWADGDSTPKLFSVPLVTDNLVEGTETVRLQLFNPRVGGVSNTNLAGLRTNATLYVLDSDAYGTLAFNQPSYQADEDGGMATIVVVRSGGLAGTVSVNYATSPDTETNPGVDYYNTNGLLVFQPGESSKSFNVTLLDDMESDGNKVVFLTLSSPTNATLGSPSTAALTLIDNESFNVPAGQLDTAFRVTTSENSPVFAVALHPTNALSQVPNRLVIAGEFPQVNNVPRNRVARLYEDGSLDFTFDPGDGPNGPVRAMAVQRDGKVILGGIFSQVRGTNRNSIARLNNDGTLDSFFNPGSGSDNPIYALLLQPDGKVLVGGAFSSFNSVIHPGIVRLNTNGTLDVAFNAGAGANATVYALAQQSNGRILIGGDFTSVNGTLRS